MKQKRAVWLMAAICSGLPVANTVWGEVRDPVAESSALPAIAKYDDGFTSSNPEANGLTTYSDEAYDFNAQSVDVMGSGESYADFCVDNRPEPAALKVFCLKPEWGSACSTRCYAKDIPCVPLSVHPYKSDGGIGKLFSCNSLLLGWMCGYHHDNGDDCYWPVGRKGFAWCAYSGNQ